MTKKKNSKLIRFISLLLCLLMILSPFQAFADNGGGDGDDYSNSAGISAAGLRGGNVGVNAVTAYIVGVAPLTSGTGTNNLFSIRTDGKAQINEYIYKTIEDNHVYDYCIPIICNPGGHITADKYKDGKLEAGDTFFIQGVYRSKFRGSRFQPLSVLGSFFTEHASVYNNKTTMSEDYFTNNVNECLKKVNQKRIHEFAAWCGYNYSDTTPLVIFVEKFVIVYGKNDYSKLAWGFSLQYKRHIERLYFNGKLTDKDTAKDVAGYFKISDSKKTLASLNAEVGGIDYIVRDEDVGSKKGYIANLCGSLTQSPAPLYGYPTIDVPGRDKTRSGFAIYGAKDPIIFETKGKVGGSLVVQYTGNPGTNVSDSYKKYYSMNRINANGNWEYLNGSSGWTTVTDTSIFAYNSNAFLGTSGLNLTNYSQKMCGYLQYLNTASNESLVTIKGVLGGLPTSDFTIDWNKTAVSKASYGLSIGNTYSFNGVTYNKSKYTNTQLFKDSFNKKLNGTTSLTNQAKGFTSYNDKAISNLNTLLDYTRTNASSAGNNVIKPSKNDLIKGKNLGVSVSFYVRSNKVTSHLKTVTISGDSVSITEEASKEYDVSSSNKFQLHSRAVALVAVPNNSVTNTAESNIKKNLKGVYNKEKAKNTVYTSLGSPADSTSSSNLADIDNFTTGSTVINNANVGYTIYQIVIDEPTITGKLELPDYLLNKYFNNVIQSSSLNAGRQNTFYINKQYDKIVNNYTVTYKDVSNKGNTIALDKNALLGDFYLKASGTINDLTRSNLVVGKSLSTLQNSNAVIDYAFNLTRGSVGDKRIISGISLASTIDADGSLVAGFGVSPVASPKAASAKRNSDAIISGTYAEKLSMSAKFRDTGSTNVTSYSGLTRQLNAFRMNNSLKKTLDYKFENTVHKYQTDTIANGANSTLGTNNEKVLTSYSSNGVAATTLSDNSFKLAKVVSSGKNLGFYPEVAMKYRDITDGKYSNTVAWASVYTMGEVKRTALSSSLYLMKLDSTGSDAISGSTISDTSSKSGNLVSIPAGSDITVKTKSSGLNIDCYAYSLDLIDKEKDSTMKVNATQTLSYNDIVKSNSEIYETWGNTKISSTLKDSFSGWVDSALDSSNFAVDLSLTVREDNNVSVSGGKTYNNFAVDVPKVTKGTVSEDGVYPIKIEHGAIDETSTGYTNLIKQIAADYEVTEGKAKELFKASGIYTSILNAIESDTSSFNKSEPTANATFNLGNDEHWYDETVKTFVVRRYTCLDNKLGDLVTTDKLDYELAGNDKAKYGKWYLTIKFKDTTKVSNNSSYNTLANGVHVTGADFLIPDETNNDFGN